MISLAFSAFLIAAPAVVVDTAAAVPAKPVTRLLQRSLPDGLSAAIRISPGVPEAQGDPCDHRDLQKRRRRLFTA